MIRWSTLQWFPKPDRGEFVNVVLLAWDEGGDFEVQQSNLERANRLGEMPNDAQEMIDRHLRDVAEVAPNERTAYVQKRFEQYQGVMRFHVPMPTAYESVGKALSDLFPLLVGDD